MIIVTDYDRKKRVIITSEMVITESGPGEKYRGLNSIISSAAIKYLEVRETVAEIVKQLQPQQVATDPAEMYKRGFRQFDCPVCGFDGAVGFDPKAVEKGCLRCNTPKKCAVHGCSPNTWESETKEVI